MANQDHLDMFLHAIDHKSIDIWNSWREMNPDVVPDLSGSVLNKMDMRNVNLAFTNLSGATISASSLIGANLTEVDLSNSHLQVIPMRNLSLVGSNLTDATILACNLSGTNFRGGNLTRAKILECDLTGADLVGTHLESATLKDVELRDANLTKSYFANAQIEGSKFIRSKLIGTDFTGATISDCEIYGISAWDIILENSTQSNLNISPYNQSPILVDDLEVAQFIYLLLNNSKIRNVIDTITSKAVLILGRFSNERKVVLDAIKAKLRLLGFLPILFDFTKPESRNLTETVRTLAHLSCFVIADLTNPSSIPHEIMSFTTELPSVPVQPVILASDRPFAMFLDAYMNYPWILTPHEYNTLDELIHDLEGKVIHPAMQKVNDMRPN